MARKRRGRGEGAIFQREDNGLWVSTISLGYDGNGKRRRRTLYGKTKDEVQKKLRKLQDETDRGRIPEASRLTVGQFLDNWLETIKTKKAPYTVRGYERDVRLYLKPHLGNVKVRELTTAHVERLYVDLSKAKTTRGKTGVSPTMQRKATVTLGAALRVAVKRGLLGANPVRDVDKPLVERKEIRVLDLDQLGLFMKEAEKDRLYAIYVLAVDSGAREGELFALAWRDIDFAAGCIHIRHTLEEIDDSIRLKEPKTKKSRRKIPVTRFTLDALQEHRKNMLAEGHYRPDGPVFCDTAGGFLRKANVLHRSFEPILKRAGLPHFRPYDLRHTCATLLLLAGENPKVVSERLGHSSISITLDTYSHVLPTMQERAADKLNTIFQATAGAAAVCAR
jgi:integrase